MRAAASCEPTFTRCLPDSSMSKTVPSFEVDFPIISPRREAAIIPHSINHVTPCHGAHTCGALVQVVQERADSVSNCDERVLKVSKRQINHDSYLSEVEDDNTTENKKVNADPTGLRDQLTHSILCRRVVCLKPFLLRMGSINLSAARC